MQQYKYRHTPYARAVQLVTSRFGNTNALQCPTAVPRQLARAIILGVADAAVVIRFQHFVRLYSPERLKVNISTNSRNNILPLFPCDLLPHSVVVDLSFCYWKRSSTSTSTCTATSSTDSRYGSRSSHAQTSRTSPRRLGKPATLKTPSSSLSCTLVWPVTRGKNEHGATHTADSMARDHERLGDKLLEV